ncbi:hypothetical protein NLX71_19845 [Paenibacillus sp. MZ04-78.2]|nr:hypothetical protein [Paenibacillus sp. MZ04-78.2]MCP3775528.1 hypothetical protein [Paenibacillus sp. MZ04-78.2]
MYGGARAAEGFCSKAYSYVQECAPLNTKLPVRLTTYTMQQIEFCK